jgi:hypothetical protein
MESGPGMPMPSGLFDEAFMGGGRLSELVLKMRVRPSNCGGINHYEDLSSPYHNRPQDSIWLDIQDYERVIKHWPACGFDLEAAVCKVTRGVLSALRHQCGVSSPVAQAPLGLMVTSKQFGSHRRTQSDAGSGFRPVSSYSGSPSASPRGSDINSQEDAQLSLSDVMFLNSLKFLMVSIPGIEEALVAWCQSSSVASMLGAQFDQVCRRVVMV